MHDWTLLSVTIDWEAGTAVLKLVSPSGPKELQAREIADIHIPRTFPWGKSRSINVSFDPVATSESSVILRIEMQSGDTITIVAKSFIMPTD